MRLEARRPRRVIHWWQRAGLGLLTATAAAAAAWLLIPRAAVSPTGDVRFKGAGVVVQRKRVAQTRVLADSDRVRAGDLLRVVVTLQRAEPLAVWFVDARGRVDRFLREEAVLLGAGEHPLPGSAVVEAPCQDLWLVVATGTAANARTEKAMRRAVARGVPAGDGWRPRGTLVRSMRCE